MSSSTSSIQTPNSWKWSDVHNDYYCTQWVPEAGHPAGGKWVYIFSKTGSHVPGYSAVNNGPCHVPGLPSNGPGAGGAGGGGSEQPGQGYCAGPSAHYGLTTASVGAVTNSLAGLDVNSYAEPGTSSRRPQSERTASQVSEGVPGGRSQGSGAMGRQLSSSIANGFRNNTQNPFYTPQPNNSMAQSYRKMEQAQLQIASQQPQQYPPQGQQFAAQNSGYGNAYSTGTAASGWQAADKQPSPPAAGYYDDVTVENGPLIRGTPEFPVEPLDPSYRLVENEWDFFVRGRVLSLLFIENASEMIKVGSANVSLVQYGEKAFARISRFVVVDAKPDRHYSKCIPISTYSGRATMGKNSGEQKEHGIIYSGDRPPKRFEQEANLRKDAIKVDIVDPSLKLSPDSRINYAFTRPIQHNVKVKNVGKIAKKDMYKLYNYWKEYR